MTPQEFKRWLENTIRDAKIQGLSDTDIYLELLEQVRHMTTRMMLKAAERKGS